MDNISLQQHLQSLFPDISLNENRQYTEVVVPALELHRFCEVIKSSGPLHFDYLADLTAVDWKDFYMMVYHISSTTLKHMIVVKSRIDDRNNPEVDSVSDIWKSAEFHEREVYDLFGIYFKNHPDLRRLFLEDDYGFPLRKDFSDESRMIVR